MKVYIDYSFQEINNYFTYLHDGHLHIICDF